MTVAGVSKLDAASLLFPQDDIVKSQRGGAPSGHSFADISKLTCQLGAICRRRPRSDTQI